MTEEMMFDQTSQTEETQEEVLDFSDIEKETTPNDVEESQEKEPGKEPEFALPIKYNGQEETLTREQAIELAQKGRNYDHVAQELSTLREQAKELEELKSSPELTLVEQLAKSSGMTKSEYMQHVSEQMRQAEISKLMEQGVSEQYATELMQNRIELNKTKGEMEELKGKLAKIEEREKSVQMWGAFFKAHPEIKSFEELPEEVMASISKGQEPEMAYTAYENRQLKEKLAALEQNKKNKEKAPGSVTGDGKGDELDAFQRAFMANL
ncbi:MAG TPA: hypothetical protein DEA44_16690 [Firmicutes bacterium]|nr:hypothetical protein [Bacillota bacterium]